MLKSKVKIIILFSILLILIVYGAKLYQRISHNKEIYNTDVRDYISTKTPTLIVVNNNHSSELPYVYNSCFYRLVSDIDKKVDTNFYISEFGDTDRLILAKIKYEEQEMIENILKQDFVLGYKPTQKVYKNIDVYLFPKQDGSFYAYTFYRGIFALSDNFSVIKKFIDTDHNETFFSDEESKEYFDKVTSRSPISIYSSVEGSKFAFNCKTEGSSIIMDGYFLKNSNSDSGADLDLVHKVSLPDSLCIEKIAINYANIFPEIKITLNKIQ